MTRVLDAAEPGSRTSQPLASAVRWLRAQQGRLDAWQGPRLWALLVPGTWLILTVGGLLFVVHFGLTSPLHDEWRWVDQLVGAMPIDWQWLWQAENGHRAPLFKLVYLGLMRATGCNFLSGAVANMLLLSATSLAALLFVRRERGHWQGTDVLLPAALLNWFPYFNLIWGFQLFYVLPVCLAVSFLLIATGSRPRFSLAGGTTMVLILWCLPGCGGPGICYLGPLAIWLAYAAGNHACSTKGPARVGAALIALAALASLAAIPLYFSPAQESTAFDAGTPGHAHPWWTLVSTIQILAMSVGRLASKTWPLSGVLIVGTMLAVCSWLLLIAYRQPQQRVRALGFLAFVASLTCLAAGIAVARGHIGRDYCLGERYSTLSAPLLVGLYLAVVCYSQRSCRPATGGIVFLAIVGILISYQRTALRYAPELSLLVRRLELSVHEGMPPAVVAGRCAVDSKCEVPLLAHYLELLRDASIGPYRCPELPQGESPDLTRCVGRNSDLLAKGRLELSSDQWRSQAIPLAAGRLCGIDVRLRETMREAPPRAVQWQLVAIDSKGGRSVLHNGSAEIIPSQDPLFARLRFEPVSLPTGGTLELELRRQGPASVRLPLYQFLDDPSRSSLQLFTFFTD